MSTNEAPSDYFSQFASTASSLFSFMRVPVLASSGVAAVLSGVLYFKQNELIYPRNVPADSRSHVFRPQKFGYHSYEELLIPTPDGEALGAFLLHPSNKSRARDITILMFHGNAGNIGHRVPIAMRLQEGLDCNVLMLEYRGYGLSTGTPDEHGLLIDAQTGLDYIRQRPELRDTKLVVYGQSLGGAVAIQLAAKNHGEGHIAGLILENTFTAMRKLIPRYIASADRHVDAESNISSAFPPAKYLARLCHQVWPSESTLPTVKNIPILFLSGLQDEIVPPSHMRQLFKVCRAERKVWKTLPHGSHNDTILEPEYFDTIVDFVNEEVMAKP
ncbi:MAG: hypothetical protein M1832_005666 [Thelocarpon impressellum]|nr:MAG: hypothetical protein M1832_005666 [Thelocarpon impressellum]